MVEQTKSRGVGEIGRARASVAAIETLATIRRQARRVATDAEKVVLSGWSGWGPLAKAFAPPDATWASLAERVQAALPEKDLELGLKGTYMAFYTPRELAASMWETLRLFGYDGGPVAELGCGGGVFFSTAPEGAPLLGVERDRTAAAICKLLHPHVEVVNKALEDAYLPATFSAVVGNVPFGDVSVFDPQAPAEVTGSLHNYFLWRAVQALTPGGFAVLITSRFTMDSRETYSRTELAKDADFVGAIRLPNGALGGGTDAAADIVILRRKGGHKRETHPHDWKNVQPTAWDQFTKVNEWWAEHPETVLGTMKAGTTSQYGLNLMVEPHPGRNVGQWVRSVARHLANEAADRNLMWSPPPNPEEFDPHAAGVLTRDGRHEGSMRLTADGGVSIVKDGREQKLPRPGAELMRLLRLRDLAVELVRAEADHSRPDTLIEPVRADVRAAYADYVKHHGPLNRYTQRRSSRRCGQCFPCQEAATLAGKVKGSKDQAKAATPAHLRCEQPGVDPETGIQSWSRIFPTMQGFRYDPDAPLVFALEVFADDDEGDTDEAEAGMRATPAPIQTARQNVPPQQRTRADTPEQALAWSLDRFGGRVHLEYIATVLGRPALDDGSGDEAREQRRTEIAGLLGDKVYLDPGSREWLFAEEYLSGNVRVKHRAAQTAAEHDPQFTRNVTALEAVLPRWLGPAEITANLGSAWIGPRDLETFLAEVVGYRATVKRAAGQWEVEAQGAVRGSVAGSAVWGTPEVDAYELFQLALNGKTPVVKKTVYDAEGRERTVRDREKSMLATAKQEEMRARFSEWVWEDPQRAGRLEHHYNWTYNSLRARQFDGSHITIDGMAPWFTPYGHQLSFTARGLSTPAGLCGHPVGAGKTNSMAMLVMKLKQVGLVNKPMLVVPNHLIEQIDREIRQLFPAAKILTGASKTIAANRLAFTARCATGDWDIVLVTHSAFNAMNVDPETQARYYEDLERQLRDGVTGNASGGQLKGRMVKRLAKALDAMKTRVQKLRHAVRGRDAGILFEQLGVDYIAVDEFHYYKNLALPVRTEGFGVQPSKRATDLDMKIRYLRERNRGGPHAALFSGTPVSNTMLELYVCLHYTMRPYLEEIGLGSPDEWAATFVQFVTSVEVTVDGGDFQMRTRPSLFVNAPELRVLLARSADIRTAEQLGLKRPKADLRIVASEPTFLQAWFSTDLVARAEDVRDRRVEPAEDNMLKVCNDGRLMATDPALVGLDDDGEHKLHIAARHIVDEWRANPGKLQVAFLDVGTPKQRRNGPGGMPWTDPQSYGRLRRLLTEQGMDVQRIRFIHDAKDDSAKAQLFRDCRRGKVDLVIGSTDKLGVGTNIQKLIVAMHHIDAPYRPADVEQRDGRGLRPGNIHKTVRIYRYVTRRTFDAYMWQMLTRKLTFIGQMLSGNLDRTVEDVTGDNVLSFAAIKAAATDQPLLQAKAEVEATLKQLELKHRAHRQTVARMRHNAPQLRATAAAQAERAAAWAAIAAAADSVDLDDDDVVNEIHEQMGRFRYYTPPIRVGQLTITWRTWYTRGEHPEVQPLLVVAGGDGEGIEVHGYKFWKAREIRRQLTKLLTSAATEAQDLRDSQQRSLLEAERSDELAGKPFDQHDQLTEARARLAQIEEQLRAAATREENGDAPAEDGEPEFDMNALADFAGGLMNGVIATNAVAVSAGQVADTEPTDQGDVPATAVAAEPDDLEQEVAAGLAAFFGGGLH